MFEDDKDNKYLSSLRTGQFETERGSSTDIDLSSSKEFGAIGAILLAISMLTFNNIILNFGTIMAKIMGYIFILISLYRFSKVFNNSKIFSQALIGMIFQIASTITIFGYNFLQLSFLKGLAHFATILGLIGILYTSFSFELMYRYTKVVFYRIFAFANPIAQILPLFLLLLFKGMDEITTYILFLAIFLSLYIVLMIAFYTTPTKMKEDKNMHISPEKQPGIFDSSKTSEILKVAVEDMDTNEPVMVLRYTFFRTLSLVLFYLLCFFLFLPVPLMGLGIIPLGSVDNLFNRFLCVTLGPLGTIISLWKIIDLTNTKQIEVYRDRITKRVKIPFPMQRDKSVYYKGAKYQIGNMGMLITEAKNIPFSIGYLGYSKGFYIYTTRFKGKDNVRFAKFLAQVSGRNEGEFLILPTFSSTFFHKLIKE